MTLREFALQHNACQEGLEWLGERDLQAMWAECHRSDWMAWLLFELGWDDARTMRLYACWCVRQVWHLLTDEHSRNAVEVAERYAAGNATDDELASAWTAAMASAGDAAGGAAWAAAWASAGAAQANKLRELVPYAVAAEMFAAQTGGN
jgi:hypothetical protein